MCHGQGCGVFLGMGDLPPLMNRNPYFMGPYNAVYWGYNPFTNHLLTSWDILVYLPPTFLRLT